MSTSKKWQLFGCLVLVVLGLDQVTKLYVHTTFALYESRPVIAARITSITAWGRLDA